jgi:cyanophycin synthetase
MDLIRARAESMAADIDKVPGRFNVLEIEGTTVVVDYGHNVHSLTAVIQAIDNFPQSRRTCLYTTAGDRRDVDIIRQGELLGAAFDRVVLYEDHYRRGRAEGEIMGLLRQGLNSASRAKEIIEVVGANKACETTLNLAQPGELVLLQADTIDETVQWLREYLEALAAKAPAEEEILDEAPIAAVKPPAAAEKLSPAEVQSEVLAEVHTVAKV